MEQQPPPRHGRVHSQAALEAGPGDPRLQRRRHCRRRSREAPEQWTIGRLDEYGLTEEIERLLNYVDEDGRSVAPPWRLVKAYKRRYDGSSTSWSPIATQPIVLADGKIIGSDSKYDPERGIQFIVSDAIAAMVPKPEECTPAAVATAMEFLTDDWLVDVSHGLHRQVRRRLYGDDDRGEIPAAGTAGIRLQGRQGENRQDHVIKMLIEAVTGTLPSGSAWSMDVNERRKSIMSYFLAGVPYILWDNIPRGFQISCPHIELSCSFSYLSDRLLGANEMVRTACASIHPSFHRQRHRSRRATCIAGLAIELDGRSTRPGQPAVQPPRFPDWTLKNRGEILRRAVHCSARQPDAEERSQRPDEDQVSDVVPAGRVGGRERRAPGSWPQIEDGGRG